METREPEGPKDLEAAMKAVSLAVPEPIREHWADIGGVRYPPKQAYQLISHLGHLPIPVIDAFVGEYEFLSNLWPAPPPLPRLGLSHQ